MANPRAQARFKERAELLDFLLEVSDVTTETLDLDRLLASVAEIVKRVIPYELFAILLYSERRQGLTMRYSIGHRPELAKSLLIRLGEGITGRAALEREPILVGDVRTDERYISGLDAVRSELAAPMIARGRLVGVIDLESTRVNAFTEYDKSLLRLLASRVAFSIDNARLYRRVERQNRTLRTLTALSQEFSSILKLDELLGKIASTVRALINYDAFSVLLLDEDLKILKHRFSVRYDQRVQLDNVPLGLGITGAAAASREPVRVVDTSADPRYIPSHPDIRSEIAVPLIVRDRVIGVLDLESERLGYFTEEHLRTLSLLAPSIAIAVENARLYEEIEQRERRLESDLLAARKLQSLLLPRQAPEIAGLEIGVGRRPAREVSGDLYDFFDEGDYSIIAFGDSSGKGVAAALYGAMVTGVLRSLAPRRRGPAMLLAALNDALLERKVDAHYVALLVLLWEARERQLTVANAGASPPLIYHAGKARVLNVEGMPLGLLENRDYEPRSEFLDVGDVVLLYSDGFQDQHNPQREEYGRDRLAAVLEKAASKPAQAIVNALFADLDRFAGGHPQFDDQTVLVLKVI
jgi:sigma-B regulation protein RsbU (phosphoserine phosphatase)